MYFVFRKMQINRVTKKLCNRFNYKVLVNSFSRKYLAERNYGALLSLM